MPAEPTAIIPDKGQRGCLNTLAADIPKGTFVVLTTGAADAPFSIAIAGNGARVFGVTAENILGTDSVSTLGLTGPQRGSVQIAGKAIVTAGAAVARGSAIGSDAAGLAVVAASGDIVAGQGVTVGVSTEGMEVELAGPGGGSLIP